MALDLPASLAGDYRPARVLAVAETATTLHLQLRKLPTVARDGGQYGKLYSGSEAVSPMPPALSL
jgi:hypothetical protein